MAKMDLLFVDDPKWDSGDFRLDEEYPIHRSLWFGISKDWCNDILDHDIVRIAQYDDEGGQV